jgi:hypothetical protein
MVPLVTVWYPEALLVIAKGAVNSVYEGESGRAVVPLHARLM